MIDRLNHDEFSKQLRGSLYYKKANDRLFIPTATGFSLNFAKPIVWVVGGLFTLIVIWVRVWGIVQSLANKNAIPNR